MEEMPSASPGSASVPPAVPPPKKRRKDKVRSAWISFVGRIVAQIVGAVASIALAIAFLQQSRSSEQLGEVANRTETRPRVERPARAADRRVSIVVLPLANFSGDSRQDYVADGMTEALIADLAQIDGLRVISRTSAMHYRGTQKPLPEIAAELGVEMVVEGSVVRVGERVRVTAQLVEAATDEHLWARTYDRTSRDVLALQGELASEIAKELRRALSPHQQARLTKRAAIDAAVYDLYLRGRHAWNLRTDAGFKIAVEYFEKAIAAAPSFALAHAGVADALVLQHARPEGAVPGAIRERTLTAIERALTLDPELAEAHASRGAALLFWDGDHPAAEQAFRRAIELNVGYATARQWYAILLAEQKRDSEALAMAKEAVLLDPMSGTMRQSLGLVHYYGRRYQEAERELRAALDLAPQLPIARSVLAKALFIRGAYDDANTVIDSAPRPIPPDLTSIAAAAHVRAGNTQRGEALLQELSMRPADRLALAQAYAALGDAERAIQLLVAASRLPGQVLADPLFDEVRQLPRFQSIARGTTP